ncbi:MAG TPA: cation:proton antiporter [Erysipelothrix sp.]|nr:cation:proton antiporter [Erysipelothrix sp.]
MNIYFTLSLLLAFGLIGGRVARRFKLPNVTGYLLGGLLLGPSFLNQVGAQELPIINFVNEVSLAAIAFNIGGEFLFSTIKRVGKDIFIITVFEVLGVVALVFSVLYFVADQSFVFSLISASMSAATAPAGTLMVIRQYRAKGVMTDAILPIAALDDALGIMVFGLALAAAKFSLGITQGSTAQMILAPFIEIGLSLIVGLVLGLIVSKMTSKIKSQEELVSFILIFILISPAIARFLPVSSLLVSMAMGAVYVNMSHQANRTFNTLNTFVPPINVLFFAFAGASLDLSILASIGTLGILYVLARMFGKVLGTSLGAKVTDSDPKLVKYLGWALLPQGGISIGLSMIVRNELPEVASGIVTLILFSVLFFEIMGPIFAKMAISKAGELNEV